MAKDIWFNLPSKDLAKAKEFFVHIGFKINEHPGSANDLVSLFVGDKEVVLNLFPEATFKNITQNGLVETSQSSEVLFSLGADSREDVDVMAQKVSEAGGIVSSPPKAVLGWMYGFGFSDLDGHRWNVLFMDVG